MPTVAVSAPSIDTAGIALDMALPVAWLNEELADAELTAEGPGRITGRLSRSGESIVVRSRIKADLVTPCARCLAPAAVNVDTELSLLLKPAPQAARKGPAAASHGEHKGKGPAAASHGERKGGSAGGKENGKRGAAEPEYEFTTEEADEDTYDGETVVLDPFIREAILLEVPNFPLCSEACPGIRPAAAPAALPVAAVDPRLAPLSALRAKLGQGDGSSSAEEPGAGHDGGASDPKPRRPTGAIEPAPKRSGKQAPKLRSSQLSPKKKKKKKE